MKLEHYCLLNMACKEQLQLYYRRLNPKYSIYIIPIKD